MAQENLADLVKRLENVAVRLESYADNKIVQNGHAAIKLNENPVTNLVKEVDLMPASVKVFDELISNYLEPFVRLSTKLNNDVKIIAELVDKLFQFERSFLLDASNCVQPTQEVLVKFYGLFSKYVQDIISYREKNRASMYFNHYSAISESIGALSWIAIQPAPAPYVREMEDAAKFYTNRVLKEYKEKDANHVEWVKLWLHILAELQVYVRKYHTTGVVWNSEKKSAEFDPFKVSSRSVKVPNVNGIAASLAPPPPTPPPPPPPPPMPDFGELLAEENNKSVASINSLFAELNKGEEITSKLKKVPDDQKTHKNPALRVANYKPSSSVDKNSAPVPQKNGNDFKPAVFELEDKKWKIEYQVKQENLIVDQTDMKQSVYVYKCRECTIIVKGKVNSILIDSCNRVGILFDDVLSTVEFINSTNVQMQATGKVPTVAIEKTDGCQVYLSKSSIDAEIVSSKSSSMNVLVVNEAGDDFDEFPVPEQFKTRIDSKTRKLVTTATESC